jgi:hypothetical protein
LYLEAAGRQPVLSLESSGDPPFVHFAQTPSPPTILPHSRILLKPNSVKVGLRLGLYHPLDPPPSC